jgi:SAM-dependent methyltransferase
MRAHLVLHLHRLFTSSAMSTISKQGDAWAKLAADTSTSMLESVNRAADGLVKVANAVHPLSRATLVLDVGSGQGAVLKSLFEQHGAELPEASRVHASDLSPGMVERIRAEKAAALGAGKAAWQRLDITAGDAGDLSAFADGSASHVFGGLVYFFTPTAALREARRVLAPGGVLAASSWERSDWLDLMRLAHVVKPGSLVEPQSWPQWETQSAVRAELVSAGFAPDAIRIETVEVSMTYADASGLCRWLLELPNMKPTVAKMSKEEAEKLEEMMIARLRETRGESGLMVGTAIVAVGQK